jgi:hypothetical protein
MNETVAEIIEITDQDLEMEFEKNFVSLNSDIKSKIKELFAETPNPIGVGSWNSSFQGCCCTIASSSEVCGGNGFLPTAVECLAPGQGA